jgi:hypothetical protein
VRVPDLGGTAGEISRTGGAKTRGSDEEDEEKGEVFHGWRCGRALSMRPS